MEEILASIRRIISEDDAPEEAKPEAAAAEEPEAEPDFGPVAEEVEVEEPEVEEAPAAAAEDVLELTETYDAKPSVSIGDIDAFDAPEPAPAPAPKPAPAPAPKPAAKAAPAVEGGLVSANTETSAASAFGSLSSALLVPHSERTLEDVTKDLLRPLLQQWLDTNLPAIVEEQVRIEVERIARQSRR